MRKYTQKKLLIKKQEKPKKTWGLGIIVIVKKVIINQS